MVKWTRSTAASDFSRLRHVRSPACGSPETSSTRRFSRTPSAVTTTRLLAGVSSPGTAGSSISRMFWPGCGNCISSVTLRLSSVRRISSGRPSRRTRSVTVSPARPARPCLAHGHLDGAGLADDAELRRVEDLDAAVELVGPAGQQRVHRRVEAEPAGRLRHVVDLAVGDHDDAGEAVGRRRWPARWLRSANRLVPPRRVVGARGRHPLHLQARDPAELAFEVLADLLGLLGPAGQRLAGRIRRPRRWRCCRGSRAPPPSASDWRAPAPARPAPARAEQRPASGGTAAAPTSTAASTTPAQNTGAGTIGAKSIDQLLIATLGSARRGQWAAGSRQRGDGASDICANAGSRLPVARCLLPVATVYCPSRSSSAGTCTWSAL